MRGSIFGIGAILLSVACHAATPGAYGNWSVGSSSSGHYTFTTNDSGEVLGEYCFYKSATCQWELGLNTACKTGADGIFLANADTQATPLEVSCTGQLPDSALYVYVFKNWKLLESALQSSSMIGFAVPLASDQFGVVRFSLLGRVTAQSAMESAFFGSKKVKHNTADQVL